MNNIHTLQYDLRHSVTGLMPKYASALNAKIDKYLSDGEPAIVLEDSASVNDTADVQGTTAIITLEGVICKRVGLPQEVCEFLGICDLDIVDIQLKEVLQDDSITSVILHVTSPGGYVQGLQSTYDLISQLASKKETVVYSDLLNASAAYYISCAASSILASIDADIGAIGQYCTIEDYSKMLDNEGIKVRMFKSGKYKGLGDPTQMLTDEQAAYIQSEVDKGGAEFRTIVSKTRTIAEEDMQGQLFRGQDATDKGFIDGIVPDITDVLALLNR